MENPRERGVLDWVLEVVAVGATIWGVLPIRFYSQIGADARIPTHYNIDGVADGWGDKSMLMILPIMILAIYVGLTVMERFYKKFNYPTMQITMSNAIYSNRIYRLGVRMVRAIKPIIIVMLAYLYNAVTINALDGGTEINPIVMSGLLILLLVVVCIYMIMMIRAKYRIKE
ncbi:MAG: DUF1648 domain-containing protein [Bacteroidales bacterium]